MKATRILRACGIALLSTTFLLALAPAARASEPTYPNLVYLVTLNVSSLGVSPDSANAPFSLDFQLETGSGNVTNTVTLSNFQFTGGSASGTPDYTNGNESGSLATTLILTSNTPNTASDNEFAEAFSSGVTQISFLVSQTPNSEVVTTGTPIPDQFNIAILDTNLNNIPTTDPSSGNTLLSSAIASSDTVASVNTYSSLSPDAGVTLTVRTVPEPSTYAALLGGLAVLGMMALRRRACNA